MSRRSGAIAPGSSERARRRRTSLSAWAADAPESATAAASQPAAAPSSGTESARVARAGHGRKDRDNEPTDSRRLATVIVTAQKRAERLQEVPIPVTVIRVSGARLPYNMPFSEALSGQERLSLTDGLASFVGANVSYVGDKRGESVAVGQQRSDMPGYDKVHVNAGVQGRRGPPRCT